MNHAGKQPGRTPERVCNTEEIKKFFNGWGLYWRIVEYNYTGHKEVYARLNRFLREHFSEPFNIVDFGCGDSSYMVRGLAGTTVKSYLGIDISDVALDLARENLEGLGYDIGFIQGDYFQVAREIKLTTEVIWIGLSFHHLSTNQKRKALGAFKKILSNDGYLLIFDPILRPEESRDEFLRRFRIICRTEWIQLSPEEREAAIKHVIAADFPESIDTLEEMARENGFTSVRILGGDQYNLFKLISICR